MINCPLSAIIGKIGQFKKLGKCILLFYDHSKFNSFTTHKKSHYQKSTLFDDSIILEIYQSEDLDCYLFNCETNMLCVCVSNCKMSMELFIYAFVHRFKKVTKL